MTTANYVQKFDSVPQFWQFLKGLSSDDLIVELIQNDLDANAKHTSISFELDRLVCQGDGESVGADGWERLSYVMGAGDQVDRKQFRIGVKNHGLKACFNLGDDILLRSDGLRMVQTLYRDGPDAHPSPGTLPSAQADESAPSVGCSVEVPYRTKKLNVSKGEPFDLEPTDEEYIASLFLDACRTLPVRLMGVVCPGVRERYTLSLSHHKLGKVKLNWRAKKPKTAAGKGRVRFTLFSRVCDVASDVPTICSEMFYEQACTFKGSIPRGINPEIPEFFQPERKTFRMEVAWATDKHGKPAVVTGVRRYPIGYAGSSHSAFSRLGVHFSGPYRSDGERHGATGHDVLNDHIDGACRDALVGIMACHLLPRHGAKAMELYVARDQPDDQSLQDILERAIEKKAIPLQPVSASPRSRRKPVAPVKRPASRSNSFLGPRRKSSGGTKLILIPSFTWDNGRFSPILSQLCPKTEDQIDKSVPQSVLRYLATSEFIDSVIAFDENDVIERFKYGSQDGIFSWKNEAEWRSAISDAANAGRYLDVLYTAVQKGEVKSEELVARNVHLPDSNLALRPLKDLYSGANLPSGLNNTHIGPFLHSSLRDHQLLRRKAWKPHRFTIDDYLDHADLESAAVDLRKSFWHWLRGNWRQLKTPTLRKIARLPIWPDASGYPRRLEELCEPTNKRILSVMGNVFYRPAGEILRSRIVKSTGRGVFALRREPKIEEVENFLSARSATFPRDRALTGEEKKDFQDLEAALGVLAGIPQLKQMLEGISQEYAVALNGEGFLKKPTELVDGQGIAADLHLPARHKIDRPMSILDRVIGWAPKSQPSTSQLRDALREDSSRIHAHVKRLQHYVKESRKEGISPYLIRELPCIPVEGLLYSPNQLALRGQRDFWGSWKKRVPLTGISVEVQGIYKDVGVMAGQLDADSSRRFFEWLHTKAAETIANHTDQILRQIQHSAGPRSWESTYPGIPFIPVEGNDGRIRLVTKKEATQSGTRIVIPDFEPLEDRIRAIEGNRPAELAIVESVNVGEPITADLLGLGLRSLRELAREPVSVIGEGNAGEPTGFHFLQALDALKSGARGRQLAKRLDRLDLNKSQNKLRSNWKERLSGIKSVKTADTVTARYRLSRREFPIDTSGRLDRESGTLWLRSGPDMEESFFDVVADLIFELPQQYLGSVLQRAYKIELRERNHRLIPDEDGPQDEPDFDGPENSDELTSATVSNAIPSPDPSKNSPSPGPIPSSSGGSRNGANATRANSNRSRPADEVAQIDDLKENQYAWHCQACLSGTEPQALAPASSYAFLHQNRRQIMEAHHCDRVEAGGCAARREYSPALQFPPRFYGKCSQSSRGNQFTPFDGRSQDNFQFGRR